MSRPPQNQFDPLSSAGFFAEKRAPYDTAAATEQSAANGGPSLFEMSSNLAHSMRRFVKSGFKIVDTETLNSRLAICERCPQYQDSRCTHCGCFVSAKARLATEECPLGHWPAITPRPSQT